MRLLYVETELNTAVEVDGVVAATIVSDKR
jgi:hypothetical protein